MARVKRAVNAHKKRRVVLERASGYRGQRSRLYRKAKEQILHSMTYAYRDRKDRKGAFRRLWIQRINAAARADGMTYNRFIQGLKLADVEVDRRMLAELAVSDPAAFSALVEVAKNALAERRPGRGQRGGLTPPRPGDQAGGRSDAAGRRRAHQHPVAAGQGRPPAGKRALRQRARAVPGRGAAGGAARRWPPVTWCHRAVRHRRRAGPLRRAGQPGRRRRARRCTRSAAR